MLKMGEEDDIWRADDSGDDFDEEDEGIAGGVVLTDDEIEGFGSLDGELDASMKNSRYGGFGMSIDLDDLSDEQRERYEIGYEVGWDSNSWDEDEGDEWGS